MVSIASTISGMPHSYLYHAGVFNPEPGLPIQEFMRACTSYLKRVSDFEVFGILLGIVGV